MQSLCCLFSLRVACFVFASCLRIFCIVPLCRKSCLCSWPPSELSGFQVRELAGTWSFQAAGPKVFIRLGLHLKFVHVPTRSDAAQMMLMACISTVLRFSGYFESMLELWKSGKLTLREKSDAWLSACWSIGQKMVAAWLHIQVKEQVSRAAVPDQLLSKLGARLRARVLPQASLRLLLVRPFTIIACLRLTGLQSWFHLNDLHREHLDRCRVDSIAVACLLLPRKLLSLNKKLPAFWKKVQKKYVAGQHRLFIPAGCMTGNQQTEGLFCKWFQAGEIPDTRIISCEMARL